MISRSALVLFAFMVLPPVQAQVRDEARPRDLQRLQEEIANLDEEMKALEAGDARADAYRRRAEEIQEEVVYLKVKMRHHQKAGREGTGVLYDEVADVQREIRDLRDDIGAAFGEAGDRELRLPEGTEIQVRLDEPLSSKTARREDRFDASVSRPVRAGAALAIPAGARIRGIVKNVEPAHRPSKEGRLDLEFDVLYLDRSRLDVRGRVVSLSDPADKKETAGKAGIGAVLGSVVGAILGGGKGAVIGGVLGGTGAVVGTKGDDVELPEGTLLTVRLDKPLVVPRR